MADLLGDVTLAWLLARKMHHGQVDKAGEPYVDHLLRVANQVPDRPAKIVAFLHDIVEDTNLSFPTIKDIFGEEVGNAVRDLTHYAGMSNPDYYRIIRANPLALRVKLADIADNSDETRLAKLDHPTAHRLRRKYAKALEALTGDTDG